MVLRDGHAKALFRLYVRNGTWCSDLYRNKDKRISGRGEWGMMNGEWGMMNDEWWMRNGEW